MLCEIKTSFPILKNVGSHMSWGKENIFTRSQEISYRDQLSRSSLQTRA